MPRNGGEKGREFPHVHLGAIISSHNERADKKGAVICEAGISISPTCSDLSTTMGRDHGKISVIEERKLEMNQVTYNLPLLPLFDILSGAVFK